MIKGKYRYEKSKPARRLTKSKYKPEIDYEEEVIDNIELDILNFCTEQDKKLDAEKHRYIESEDKTGVKKPVCYCDPCNLRCDMI